MEAGVVKSIRGKVPAPAEISEAWYAFLQSWYNFACLNELRGTYWVECDLFIPLQDFYEGQWRHFDLSPYPMFSRMQESLAKTVTNNLPLLSVLCVG
jgi:hypothetical protein